MTETRSAWQSAGILVAATAGIAVAGVHFHVVGAMVKPFQEAYGWSRGDVALALTISSALHPFTNIAIGLLADRYGPRAIAIPGIIAFCAGLGLLGLAGPELWTWYALYTLFAILGSGASTVVWTMAVVERFEQRRGLALAISLSGAGILISVIPTIVLALERSVGLRGIYPALALAGLVLVLIPAIAFLPRAASRRQVAVRASTAAPVERRAIITSGKLWRLGLGLVLVASCVGTFIVHLQPILTDSGLSREAAARIALFLGPAMIVGRVSTGLLFDILPTRLVAGTAFLLPGLACMLLILVPLDLTSASLLAVLIGLAMGSEVDVVAYLSSRYFGTRNYGLVFGILISAYGLAVGTSSWLVGRVYDAMGTYDVILGVLTAGVVMAFALVVSLGAPPSARLQTAPAH